MREVIKIRLLQNMLEEVTSEYDYFVGRLQRLLNFNRFLIEANQAIASVQGESDLLDDLCRSGVRYAHLRLIWIGRPDAQGDFQALAAPGTSKGFEQALLQSKAVGQAGQSIMIGLMSQLFGQMMALGDVDKGPNNDLVVGVFGHTLPPEVDIDRRAVPSSAGYVHQVGRTFSRRRG